MAHDVNRRLGVPRCVAELVTRSTSEHDVTVFAGSIADIKRHRFRFVKIPTFESSRLIGHASFLIFGTATMRLLRMVRHMDFDIIHSTIGPVLSANVLTSHFCQEAEWRLIKKGVFPAPENLSKLGTFDYNLYRSAMRRGERAAFGKKGPAGLIVVSEQMKRDILQYYGDCGREISVIPNAVDTEVFQPKNRDSFREPIRKLHGIPSKAPVILFVGGDWERKGLAFATAALARVRSQDATLLVVGAGSESQYIQLAKKYGVAERVVFAGVTGEVQQYYAAADVFVLPSLYEPFGLAVAEAMASGLPVVTSANVGASFLITDRVNGFVIVNPWDEDSLAERLDFLLSDEELRRAVGERARLTAEKLSWDNVVRETMNVYKRVLGIRT